MIRQVQTGGVNIVTVEDPVECRIPGIVQVQVQERSGLTFASVLRSILRQDPNVILVGEIRDRETAQIAIQASLTGHLVLSTLHTNDAVQDRGGTAGRGGSTADAAALHRVQAAAYRGAAGAGAAVAHPRRDSPECRRVPQVPDDRPPRPLLDRGGAQDGPGG
jgi:Flp pilus assembly CpaF family ATPase